MFVEEIPANAKVSTVQPGLSVKVIYLDLVNKCSASLVSAFGSNSWSSLSFTFSCLYFLSIPPSVLLF